MSGNRVAILFIKELIKAGVIVASTTLVGAFTLGPAGAALGGTVGGLVAAGSTSTAGAFSRLRINNLWMAIISLVPSLIQLGIENWELILFYARKLINIIYNLMHGRDMSYESHLKLPPPPPPPSSSSLPPPPPPPAVK